ncbi:hypothetical protein DSM112329_00154 [Paraconexibacter sp. AEG42_29]|uniref:Uncharacterized protein n=1 Tax=Paraconexibacter sp. AEG42_29 TaxID=2997339 RepID=A0AAU7ANU3_9ACTN
MTVVLLPNHIELYPDRDGLPSVAVTFDLTPSQVEAVLHGLRTVREARYALSQISTDDAIALREFTALIDVLADLSGRQGVGRVQMTVARLGVLRTALAEFASGEHLEREGDALQRPIILEVLDAVEEIHVRAVRAALDGALTPNP